ncbi:MAG: hypothetical protein KKI08_24755, partial [Armatimonadetes bacterium]|nr:hypothetical protein [Armatimonadota bacterium]
PAPRPQAPAPTEMAGTILSEAPTREQHSVSMDAPALTARQVAGGALPLPAEMAPSPPDLPALGPIAEGQPELPALGEMAPLDWERPVEV